MTRFKAAYVSGPPATGRIVPRDEGGHVRGILPFTISEVLSLEPVEPDPVPEVVAPHHRVAGDAARRRRRTHGGPGHGGPPGVAAAARRARHPRPADGRPHRGPPARAGLAPVAGPRRPRRTTRHRRPAARAASRHPHPQPQRRRRPRRRRRRPAQRQEHAAAVAGHEHVAHHDADRDAVLRARLRRRHVRADGVDAARGRRRHPVGARRRPPDRGRGAGRRRPSRGLLPRQRHRLDRDLPLATRPGPRRRRVRRRVPRHRRLEHAALRLRRPRDGDPAARLARPHLRPARAHGRRPLGRLPGRDARPPRNPSRAAAG